MIAGMSGSLLSHDAIEQLIASGQEPELAADILFGARALLFLEDRLGRRLLDAWGDGETSLRRPLVGAGT